MIPSLKLVREKGCFGGESGTQACTLSSYKTAKLCKLASKVSELGSVDWGMQTLNFPSGQMWTLLMDGKFSQPIK